ncbi:glycoside hydrolase family 5 protein [Pelomonas sp. Root1217]|uniref:glycoside hydrolase family 5 protein n=1 Tax=Pelomonas sp. Root1217 TaxID=1736430 RepID=UPI000B306418|nr:glycoside hydrolase family 5 protein [Pelomonas sp. Root1217]
MKRVLPTLGTAIASLAFMAVIAACAGPAEHAASLLTRDSAAAVAGMRGLTSVQLSKEMVPGINLGNTLEAIPTATSWGQPVPTQALMNGYKAAGFKSVRLPVAWSQYADKDNNISPAWMAHVKQVVDYAHKAGLYVMVNVHWDGGWMDHPTYDKQAAINGKLAKFWVQIATTFKDYDDHLLFAGSNEVGMLNTSGAPKPEWAEVQNSFNQTFVDTVRATGSNNATRHLIVQGYWTSIEHTVAHNTIPKDSVPNRLFMEVHYYDPYNFTLNGDSKVWQWGAIAKDPAATETWANEAWADKQFQLMKTHFVDKGVGVIVGEYGAYQKAGHADTTYRHHWARYVTHSIVQHGLVPVWWDVAELVDRNTGEQKLPALVRTIVEAAQ